MTTKTTSKAIYAATAIFNGKAAGHVCYGRTREECEAKARKATTVTFKVKRELATEEEIAKLAAVGKL